MSHIQPRDTLLKFVAAFHIVGELFAEPPFSCARRSYVHSSIGEARVGKRKRARPAAVAVNHELSDGRGTIPVERSLVSIDEHDY